MRLRTLALMLTAAIGTPATAADDLYTRYFAGAAAGKPCYARTYDDAHLKAHPKQQVRRIEIDFDVNERSDPPAKNSAANFQAGIGFMLKRSREWYGQALVCNQAGDHFECYLEADGGTFNLYPRGEALRLEITGGPSSDIHTEGAKDFGEFGGPGTDDRVFILPRADRKLCDAAKPN
ncbi:hypothetical protein DW352_13735 [Pseudolabrys taiwanensis]|uniref:DUF3617 family protein n=1 Tax=Pseudolabrys taiwanensis TaxID=331696 RepID=A0A345ZX29_9HYPH|nr:hypothetical protein [Pseudolabrys taiwanensis]AXK81476.1 hypothetical protein DW352_13735 [Pseudolabrys taiwanensis]